MTTVEQFIEGQPIRFERKTGCFVRATYKRISRDMPWTGELIITTDCNRQKVLARYPMPEYAARNQYELFAMPLSAFDA
jgi:hypothetical protein